MYPIKCDEVGNRYLPTNYHLSSGEYTPTVDS